MPLLNPKHVETLKKGAASVRNWLKKNPGTVFCAYKADLEGVDVSNLDLSHAIFSFAKLNNARLNKAILDQARFIRSELRGATLSSCQAYGTLFSGALLIGADCSGMKSIACQFNNADLSDASFYKSTMRSANLNGATLRNTSFRKADLTCANFQPRNLEKIDLSGAIMRATIFGYCDLNQCIGLAEVEHHGPSTIGIDTMIYTFVKAGNFFRPEIEFFLISAGTPKQLIDNIPELISNIKSSSCFVAYGEPDRLFAEKLKKDLVAKGFSCWVYSLDHTPGERTWQEIIQKRREADKMIVLCSAASLVRDGVLKEIEEQIDEDPEKIIPVSIDDVWKASGFPVKRGARDLKQFLLDRNYADFTDRSKYHQSFCKLLKGLSK